MSIAWMFPGQGAQATGMGKDLYEKGGRARAVFDAADEALGFPLTEICFLPEHAEKLNRTAYAQPALLTVSLAAAALLGDQKPDYVLGLSLGEYSALAAAGGLNPADAARLVHKRGLWMAEAVPPGEGAMSAVMNLPRDLVAAACAESADAGLAVPANFNTPDQIVISGQIAAVEKAEKLALEKGARRVIRLKTDGPFHTPLMAPAAEKLAAELGAMEIAPLRYPLVTNTIARPIGWAEIKQNLVRQMVGPVLWEDSVRWLIGQGVDTFIEVGPGNTLVNFVKKIDPAMRAVSYREIV